MLRNIFYLLILVLCLEEQFQARELDIKVRHKLGKLVVV